MWFWLVQGPVTKPSDVKVTDVKTTDVKATEQDVQIRLRRQDHRGQGL
jgi:hypothetical protein